MKPYQPFIMKSAPIEPWDMGQQRFTVLNKQKAELFETDRETSI